MMSSLIPFWYIIIAVLWTGFFILEGFDFGVGMLHGVVGRDEAGRRAAINTIGPLWDGNEVWLIVAGAAMFAAFPGWYATMFSAYNLALVLLLAALIVRGLAFEYRGKRDAARWRRTWDAALTGGSVLAPLLIGVALAGLLGGLPINSDQDFTGSFWDLLHILAVLAAVWLVRDHHEGFAFAATAVIIASCIISIFADLDPNVMVSTTSPAYNLTVHNTASGGYSLKVMTVVVIIFLPLVLAYQTWTYYVFRRRVSRSDFQPAPDPQTSSARRN
jgi:cytochrome bd-type quinol oxidase subunit 2